MIVVDYREASILELLPESTRENLIHGDIIIKDKHDNPYFIIERKTISDLSSSIKDSRFREQKSRLSKVYPSDRIIYIIEECKKSKFNLPEKTLRSAILNLSLKHKFIVVSSKGISDTVEIIKAIDSKVNLGELTILENTDKDNIGFTPITKASVVKENFLACQLATIPGVSASTANLLQEKFSTMKNFIDNLASPDCLKGINISEKRKIGVKLSEKIYNSLL